MCNDCNDNIINPVPSEQPYCEQCAESSDKCIHKFPAECVIYNLRDDSPPTRLINLEKPNKTNLKEILERIDELLGNGYNIALTATDSTSINFTTSGAAGHSLTGVVKISASDNNIISINSDGLYVPDISVPSLQQVCDVGHVTTTNIRAAKLGVGKEPVVGLDVAYNNGILNFNGKFLNIKDSLLNINIGFNTGLERTGANNIGIGDQASIGGITNNTISIGEAAALTVIGDNGVYIGRYSGLGSDGDNNVMVGHLSGANTFTNNSVLIGYNTSGGTVAQTLVINNTNFQLNSSRIHGLSSILGGYSVGQRLALSISGSTIQIGGLSIPGGGASFKVEVIDSDTVAMLYNGEFTSQGSSGAQSTIKIYNPVTNVIVIGSNASANISNQIAIGNDSHVQLKVNVLKINTSIAPTNRQVLTWNSTQGEARWKDESPIVLTFASTTVWNINNSENASLTLTGNTTLSITNATAGTCGILTVLQDGTGSRTITLPSGSIVSNGGGGTITLSTAPNAKDVLGFYYDGTNFWWRKSLNYT